MNGQSRENAVGGCIVWRRKRNVLASSEAETGEPKTRWRRKTRRPELERQVGLKPAAYLSFYLGGLAVSLAISAYYQMCKHNQVLL